MRNARHILAGTIAAALLSTPPARAETLSLTWAATAYQDDKEGKLKTPEGVACTEAGQVVVADSGNGRLVSYKFKEGAFSFVSETRYPQLGYPVRLQIDSKGDVLSLDQKSRRLVRTGAAGFAGYVELGEVPGAAPFPVAFKLDKADHLHLLDAGSSRVLAFDPAGKLERELPLPKGKAFTDVAVDGQGNLFVIEAVEAVVYVADKKAAAFKPLSKSLKGYMNFPVYVAVTERGFLVLSDRHGNGLAVVGPEGSYLGRRLSIGAGDGFLYYPGQTCLTAGGDLFVADRNNHRVQAFAAAK